MDGRSLMIMELSNTRIIIELKRKYPLVLDHVVKINDNYQYDDSDYIQIACNKFNPVTMKRYEIHYIVLKKDVDYIKVELL